MGYLEASGRVRPVATPTRRPDRTTILALLIFPLTQVAIAVGKQSGHMLDPRLLAPIAWTTAALCLAGVVVAARTARATTRRDLADLQTTGVDLPATIPATPRKSRMYQP